METISSTYLALPYNSNCLEFESTLRIYPLLLGLNVHRQSLPPVNEVGSADRLYGSLVGEASLNLRYGFQAENQPDGILYSQ